MENERKRIIIFFSSLGLCLFSLLTMGLVFVFYFSTEVRIQESHRLHQKQILYSLIEDRAADNEVEFIEIQSTAATKTDAVIEGFSILRLNIPENREQEKSLGVILATTSQDGYSGSIDLLVAINNNGEVIAARVSEHHETPGLGDKIEKSKSSWIDQFKGKKLNSTIWDVRKDGGDFESLTGATISSRAVIKAVEESLVKWGTINK